MPIVGKNILAIDDTSAIRTFLRLSLEDEGANFYEASTANEGFRLSNKIKPDVIVLDLGLPDQDGLDLLPELALSKKNNFPVIIVLTVRKGKETIDEALRKGADAYITKPFMVEDLIEVIEDKLKKC